MNILSRDKQIEIIAALTEGCSIRAVERLTGVHRDTIMRLGARVGRGCARLHDYRMLGLRVGRIELDELWSFVGKKQRRVSRKDEAVTGDQYVFVALASASKAILSYRVGKRNGANTEAFVADLRERVIGAPEISTDGLHYYETAIRFAFGNRVAYGQIVKTYVGEPPKDAARRYSPGTVVAVNRQVISGVPSQISTSYVERSNLTVRMASRRFTRLTNGFSKKLENHAAAFGLFVSHYNWCRVHEATRVTPAMSLSLTDHPWSIGELLDTALGYEPSKPRMQRRFRLIQGGKL
jgi:IS1 family transposase